MISRSGLNSFSWQWECFYILSIINYWFKWRFREKESLEIMARGKRKRDKRWMWVAKPGDKIVASRTTILPSKQLSRREFRALEEIVNI
jgi:hypothetical protein